MTSWQLATDVTLYGQVWRGLMAVIVTFAAMALVLGAAIVSLRLHNDRLARKRGHLEQRWASALLDVLGGLAPPEALQIQIAYQDEAFFIAFLTRYARRLRGPEHAQLAVLAAPFLARVAHRARHGDPNVRAQSVQALSLIGMPAWANTVSVALHDPSPLVAMSAARGLARREHQEFASRVVGELYRFSRWDRTMVTAMLAKVGNSITAPLLTTLADPELSNEARATAADGLRALNALEAADIAAQALVDGDPELRAACLRLLRQTGRPTHLPAIRPLLDAPQPFVRAQAVAAFAALADRADTLRLVMPALDDPSPWVALEAARALAPVAPVELAEIGRSARRGATAAREALGATAA